MPKDSRAKRERKREAQRRSRAAESDEARDARRARDRASHRRARDEETPEMRVERQASNAARNANMRAKETPERRVERQASNAARNANMRAEETPERRAERQASNAARNANMRAEEAPERRVERQASSAARNANMRTEETPVRRAERQAINANMRAEVEESVLSIGKFNSMVSLAAFFPFKSAQAALENINAICEGVVHADLKLFLETNVPQAGKKKSMLGVSDSKIGAALQEELGLSIQTGGVVAEIIRGVRLHFHALVKGLTAQAASKAQLGLGHSYSRAKVKFNVNRADNMIIQSIALLDQLDKDINTFSMRVREWYGYHFPELIKIVSDNSTYCRMTQLICNRKELSEESLPALEEVVMDSAKAQAILDASRSSMGMDISPIDLINIEMFSKRVVSLAAYRLELQEYLRSKMSQVAPNLAALIGEVVGARLISHAGSLTNLAKYPASTVQILGAEKALFRALKTRGNTPKYGLIFHSTFIGRAAAKNKGRISRYLANKCTIASRIDCFSDVPTSVFGDKLRDQVEERLSFYETGNAPRKNLDVMKEAVKEAGDVAAEIKRKLEKQEKKREKKLKVEANGDTNGEVEVKEEVKEENREAEVTVKKKKKKKKRQSAEATEEVVMEEEAVKEEEAVAPVVEEEAAPPAKKKKKRKSEAIEPEEEPAAEEAPETPAPEKKKKKKREQAE